MEGNIKKVLVELPISTYRKYFENERLDNVGFLPLITSTEVCKNKYDIDWNIYTWEDRIELLFKFFSFNIGKKVEIGVIYGAFNSILEKSTFIIGGNIEKTFIKPIEILENGYCHNSFDFRNIYYAKCINS